MQNHLFIAFCPCICEVVACTVREEVMRMMNYGDFQGPHPGMQQGVQQGMYPGMNQVEPIVCPPEYMMRDEFMPREVPVVHPIVNVNRQHYVDVPRHYYTETTENVMGAPVMARPGFGGPGFGGGGCGGCGPRGGRGRGFGWR